MAYGSYSTGSYGSYSTGTVGTPYLPQPEKIYTWNVSGFQCDFQSWNKAVDAGLDPRVIGPNVDFNNTTVNQIYDTNYQSKATSRPEIGTRGFGFYSNSGVETKDPQHMVYYEYNGGNNIKIWNPQEGLKGAWQEKAVGGSWDAAATWVSLPAYR